MRTGPILTPSIQISGKGRTDCFGIELKGKPNPTQMPYSRQKLKAELRLIIHGLSIKNVAGTTGVRGLNGREKFVKVRFRAGELSLSTSGKFQAGVGDFCLRQPVCRIPICRVRRP